MSKFINNCDVLIVGGGLVGSVLASLLASTKLSIVLVDRHGIQDLQQENFDRRTTAVSWGSSQILQKTGIWEKLEPFASPIQGIRISQNSGSGFVHFDSEDAGHHAMGFILDNFRLRQALYQFLESCENIIMKAPHSIKSLNFNSTSALVSLEDETEINAKAVVGADGRLSQIRRQAGIQTYERSYDQTALVTIVRHENPHQSIAFEHFLPTGPLAFLPINTHESAVVWSLKTEKANLMMPLSSEEFAEELFLRFPYLGAFKVLTQRNAYPLNLTVAHRLKAQRCVLIGDAAHAIHPIAGQGANLGFRDAEQLTSLFQEASLLGIDIGDDTVLARYQRLRWKDVGSMSMMTHGLVSLFSQSSSVLASVRGLGLKGINRMPFLRQRLTRHAMGL